MDSCISCHFTNFNYAYSTFKLQRFILTISINTYFNKIFEKSSSRGQGMTLISVYYLQGPQYHRCSGCSVLMLFKFVGTSTHTFLNSSSLHTLSKRKYEFQTYQLFNMLKKSMALMNAKNCPDSSSINRF